MTEGRLKPSPVTEQLVNSPWIPDQVRNDREVFRHSHSLFIITRDLFVIPAKAGIHYHVDYPSNTGAC